MRDVTFGICNIPEFTGDNEYLSAESLSLVKDRGRAGGGFVVRLLKSTQGIPL